MAKRGDLGRKRRARDLWISRGHVGALAAGGVCAVMLSFGFGYHMGQVDQSEVHGELIYSTVPDEALVELLARVASSGETDGGLVSLTFPDSLKSDQPIARIPVQATGRPVPAVVPSAASSAPKVAPPPTGRYSLVVGRFPDADTARALAAHLRSADAPAWVGVERVDGRVMYRTSVGAYGSKAAAEAGLAGVLPLLDGAPVAVTGQPQVVAY